MEAGFFLFPMDIEEMSRDVTVMNWANFAEELDLICMGGREEDSGFLTVHRKRLCYFGLPKL